MLTLSLGRLWSNRIRNVKLTPHMGDLLTYFLKVQAKDRKQDSSIKQQTE